MSTLTALARAQAAAEGRAQQIATVRHLHLHDRPLVLIPLAMAGEANAPLAAMVGTRRSEPQLLVVPQPRNRDQRFAFAASLADTVLSYLGGFTGVAEPIAVDRGRDIRFRFVDAPQVWVPNTAGVQFLRMSVSQPGFCRWEAVDKEAVGAQPQLSNDDQLVLMRTTGHIDVDHDSVAGGGLITTKRRPPLLRLCE